MTFLYKLEKGTAPSSYGLNVARIAGIPTSILASAHTVSEDTKLLHAVPRTVSLSRAAAAFAECANINAATASLLAEVLKVGVKKEEAIRAWRALTKTNFAM